MKKNKILFIGAGNMGSAIIKGLNQKNNLVHEIYFYEPNECVRNTISTKLNANAISEINEEIANFDTVIFAVKPQVFRGFPTDKDMSKLAQFITDSQLVLSIMAGVSISTIQDFLPNAKKIIRVMPNTPALVGEGCTGVCANENVSGEELEQVLTMIRSFGVAEVVPESLMDVVVGLSGSSPAYVFMFIEAMADAAVAAGMPRNQAYTFAAQAVLGSAKMVLETGKHPGELKDMVCSPGGTTIDAVKVLEQKGFRAAVMDAMEVCAEKSRNL